jgi:hypothetical protein
MKVTSNVSFLLCITSVVMPVVDARANRFVLHERSTALKSPATKAYDFVAYQQRRGLQVNLGTQQECQEILDVLALLGAVPCTCDDQGNINIGDAECFAYLESQDGFGFDDDDDGDDDDGVDEGCFCDTLDGEKTCVVYDSAAATAASSDEVDFDCYTYTSGLFDNTICVSDTVVTCTITIDGTECNSCEVDTSCFDLNFDCSNVIDGETWNACTDVDDIPETSPFILLNDDRFLIEKALEDAECVGIVSPAASPTTGSGAFALSFHALSMVGLVVAATFW